MTKILLALMATAYVASALSDAEVERLADAIYFAEGKEKAKVPYGILSVKTRNPRQICVNTIRNSWTRFVAAGKTGDFIEHLGSTYCPIKGDRTGLNRHWVRNVKARMPARKRNFSVR